MRFVGSNVSSAARALAVLFGSVPVSTSCGQPVSSRVWYANYVCGVLSSLSSACWVPGHPVLVLQPENMHFSNRAMSFGEKESDLASPSW